MSQSWSTSTVHFLFLRELGLNESNTIFGGVPNPNAPSTFLRQSLKAIIKARVQVATKRLKNEVAEPNVQNLNDLAKQQMTQENRKMTPWTSLSSSLKSNLSIASSLDGYFMLRKCLQDRTIHCKLSFTVSAMAKTLTTHFTINGEKWEDHELWFPTYSKDFPKENVKTLIVLSKSRPDFVGVNKQNIDAYSYLNGIKLHSEPIQGNTKYSKLAVYHQEGIVIATASLSSLKLKENAEDAEIKGDFLVFSIPPFEFRYRLQVLETAVEKHVQKTEIFGSLFGMIGKSKIDLFRFEDVIKTAYAVPKHERKPHQKPAITHQLKERPHDVLYSVETANGYFKFFSNVFLPFYVTKSKLLFKVNYFGAVEDKNSELLTGEENTLEKFSGGSNTSGSGVRLLCGGKYEGYSFYSLENTNHEDSQTVMQKIFPKPKPPVVQNDILPTTTRYGRKTKCLAPATPPYQVHGIDYNDELGLFAVCVLTTEHIKLTLYDYCTMDLFTELPAVKIIKKDRIEDDDCALLIVDLNETYISVRFESGTKKQMVYCFNLVQEIFEDDQIEAKVCQDFTPDKPKETRRKRKIK